MRFEVRRDGGPGNCLADVAGNVARHLMASVDGPATGHPHMDGDELAGSCLAGLEFVELQSGFLMGLKDALHGSLVLGQEG